MGLPLDLTDLLPYLNDWSTPDLAMRIAKISSARSSDLTAMTDQVLPRLAAIDAYLDSFGAQPLDETALGLLRLTECALDARRELDDRA